MFKFTLFDLKNTRKNIMGWTIAISALMLMYMSLYSSMKDMAKMKLQSMPTEMLELFQIQDFSVMASYNGYFGMMYNIILIPVSIFAAVYAAKLVAGEENKKTIEYLYSLPISRTQLYISKFITFIIGLTIVIFSASIIAIICGFAANDSNFDFNNLIQVIKVSSFSAYIFGAISFSLCGITTKIPNSTIGSLVIVVSYFLGYLSTLLPDKASWLKYFSPLVLFGTTNASILSNDTKTNLALYFAIFVILIILGMLRYRKRDFNI